MKKMRIIDVYIQEVTRRLPEKMRTDIALELRSTIEDMLPEQYSEEDAKQVINQLGNPAVLANGYKDEPMHLIGPRYFDVYVSLLKMIVPIAVIITLITVITKYIVSYNGEEAILMSVLSIFGESIWSIFNAAIQVFFWATLTFAIIERVDKDKEQQPLTASMQKWTADDLKNVPYIPKKRAISKFEVFGSLLWTAIWATLYFYANQLIGVYEGDGTRLQFVMIALNQEVLLQYLPLVILIIGLEISFALYKLLKQQWTKGMAIWNAVLQLLSTVVFVVIVINPEIMNDHFVTYMMELFTMTRTQFSIWVVGSAIIIFIVSAVISVYDGFKRANAR